MAVKTFICRRERNLADRQIKIGERQKNLAISTGKSPLTIWGGESLRNRSR